MRNFKKVLSLVLCMAMMLSVMVVGAGAAFKDQSKINNAEAVDACAALNIINGYTDGSFRPEGTITRAEACKMICIALNGGEEPTLGTSAKASFTDTKGHWAEKYIESCVAQGIVAGIGGGKFNPNGNVTGTQFAKMLLIALGYNSDNQGYTGAPWEVNVNVDASAKGLYAGLAGMDPSVALSRDNAAQMVWNALNAYEVEYKYNLVTENGQLVSKLVLQDKVVGTTNDKITLMEDKYEAETYVGTFNGNHDTGATGKDGQISVGSKTCTYDFDLKYIGEEVKVVYKDSKDGVAGLDNKDTVYGVYVTGETDVYNVVRGDLQKTDAGKIKIDGEKYDVAKGSVVYVNYVKQTEVKDNFCGTNGVIDMDNEFASAAEIKFVANDNGDIAAAYVMEKTIGAVTAVGTKKVTINNGVGAIEFEDNNIYDGIKKDDVVTVQTLYKAKADDNGAVTIIEKVNPVADKLAAYSVAKSTVKFNGATYDMNNENLVDLGTDFKVKSKLASSMLEEDFNFYMIGNYVAAVEMTSDGMDNYAYVVDAQGDGSKLDPYKAYVVLADGKEDTYKINSDSLTTDGTKIARADDIDGKLVKYSINSDGVMKVKVVGKSVDKSVSYDDTLKQLNGTVVSNNSIIFVTVGDDNYVYTIRDLNTFTASSGAIIDTDDGKVVAAHVTLSGKPTGATSDTVYGIVSTSGSVEKDYVVYEVQSNENTYTVKFDGDETTAGNIIRKGDLVYFDKASDDVYTAQDIHKVTGTNVWVKEYDESGKILTYFPNTSAITADTASTRALDDDCVIIYVSSDDDAAGDNIGVNEYDKTMSPLKPNAAFVKDANTGKLLAIFVDVDYDITQ